MHLEFDITSCVRATSKFSECSKCVDICPVDTIIIDQSNIPAFTPSECINCGGCVGVCPTESFSLSGFSSIEFFFKFLEEESSELVCQKDLYSCLSVLSVEHLISLALASNQPIIIDAHSCKCGGESDKLKVKLLDNIEEANFILESISDKRIEIKSIKSKERLKEQIDTPNRRSFLSLKGAIKSKRAFDEAVDADKLKEFGIDVTSIAGIKEKKIPDKRKLLFSILKREQRLDHYDILAEEDISFTSQKFVDESCTNCQICYRICPTGALSSDNRFSVINFDAMMCVKCHLCHDVCEPNSIKLQKGFEIKEFFEPTQRVLASFNIKRCNECGNYFTYKGGLVECQRCKIEEEEAMELHNNAKMRRENS
jgi:ferredoxin